MRSTLIEHTSTEVGLMLCQLIVLRMIFYSKLEVVRFSSDPAFGSAVVFLDSNASSQCSFWNI